MGLNDLYNTIVDEVVDNVKEAFSEEGVDEQILQSLKEAWLRRIRESQLPRQQRPQRSQHIQNQNQQQQIQPQPIQQQPQQLQIQNQSKPSQLDGSSASDDDESDGDFPDGDDDVEISDEEDKETDTTRDDEDPLNSGDDVSNDESSEMFETDNVVVCQYDKITRNRNKWKFHLKDGIMNVNGRDYVFQKAVGDAEW